MNRVNLNYKPSNGFNFLCFNYRWFMETSKVLSPYLMVHIISHMLFMSIIVFQLDLVMHFFFTDQTYTRIHRTIFPPVFGQILIFFIVCFILDLEPISYTVSREKFLKICFIKKIIEKFLRFF